jgi:hypothetical protein
MMLFIPLGCAECCSRMQNLLRTPGYFVLWIEILSGIM